MQIAVTFSGLSDAVDRKGQLIDDATLPLERKCSPFLTIERSPTAGLCSGVSGIRVNKERRAMFSVIARFCETSIVIIFFIIGRGGAGVVR
jgi:hypothetical protein